MYLDNTTAYNKHSEALKHRKNDHVYLYILVLFFLF